MLDKWILDIQVSAVLLTLQANNSSSLWELIPIEYQILHALLFTHNFWATWLIIAKFWLNTMDSMYKQIIEHKDMYLNLGYTCDLVQYFGSTHSLKNYVRYGIS
jgi:uncharacterized membrane protein YciS (DUF1049 family)